MAATEPPRMALIELRRFDQAIVAGKKAQRQNPSYSGSLLVSRLRFRPSRTWRWGARGGGTSAGDRSCLHNVREDRPGQILKRKAVDGWPQASGAARM